MIIKKIYNDTETLVEEALEGNFLLFPGKSELIDGTRIRIRKPEYRKPKGLVKIVMGGGSGHEGPGPGGVGPGGLDAMVSGDIFAAPPAAQLFKALCAIDDGSPIILMATNHMGDVLNSKLAVQMCREKGIDAHLHLLYNDVASAPKGQEKERRATMGVYSVAAVMAENGAGLEEILRVAEKTNEYTRSYGVGIRSAIHPVTGLPIMELPEDEIEMGIGVHGEGSGKRIKLPRSRELAKIVCDILLEDMPVARDEEIAVSLQGLGGMTWAELYILYKDIYYYLTDRRIRIYSAKTGNAGTQELGGFILAIARLDDEIKKWLAAGIPDRYSV
jgi:dihydroxyacetone kinase-like protein